MYAIYVMHEVRDMYCSVTRIVDSDVAWIKNSNTDVIQRFR